MEGRAGEYGRGRRWERDSWAKLAVVEINSGGDEKGCYIEV